MNISGWTASIDRVQRTKRFKVAASIVVVLAALALSITYWITLVSREGELAPHSPTNATSPATAGAPGENPAESAEPTTAGAKGAAKTEATKAEDLIGTSSIEIGQKAMNELFAFRTDPTIVAVASALGAAMALIVIWIDLGLTYLILLSLAACVALPLMAFARTTLAADWGVAGGVSFLARTLTGASALVAVFTALMRALQFLLSGAGPIMAIARTVLIEAVRIKLSLVLIILLVLALALLPDLMNASTPLRHRVQAFLTYGTGGPFWLIALLTTLFAAASVAFEQRDKQIWHTMTKPVAPWQYVLGKWIGVMGLSAVLMGASASGVFLFVEYLRTQPAQGESVKTLGTGGLVDGRVSEDRLILERQILAARVVVEPDPGRSGIEDTVKTPDDPEFKKILADYLAAGRLNDPNFAKSDVVLEKLTTDLYKQYVQAYRAIGPGQAKTYVFSGLSGVESDRAQLLLRFKVEAGMNDPSQIYAICMSLNGLDWIVRNVGLSVTQSVPVAPFIVTSERRGAIPFDSPAFAQLMAQGLGAGQRLIRARDLIDASGSLQLTILNGLPGFTEDGTGVVRGNPETIGFPPKGLEISYSVGSWRMNFVRALCILFAKLAFLCMLAIAAATCLSFPVACLIAVGTFLAAETSGFLTNSLESYNELNRDGSIHPVRYPIMIVAKGVTWTFKTYAELAPTQKLADGRLIGWDSVARGIAVLAAWTVLLFALATLIFRKRELATYSGQ